MIKYCENRLDFRLPRALNHERQVHLAGFIETILPVLTSVNQWTQALSTNGQVSISLIPLAVAKTREKIQSLADSSTQFSRGADKSLITDLAESLPNQFQNYSSVEQLKFYCYQFSSFLDPRVDQAAKTSSNQRY